MGYLLVTLAAVAGLVGLLVGSGFAWVAAAVLFAGGLIVNAIDQLRRDVTRPPTVPPSPPATP